MLLVRPMHTVQAASPRTWHPLLFGPLLACGQHTGAGVKVSCPANRHKPRFRNTARAAFSLSSPAEHPSDQTQLWLT